MYERMAYRKLDQPVIVWLGLEFREVGLAIGGGAAVAIGAGFVLGLGLAGILMGFATGAGLAVLFRSLRSGGPGHVFAALYRAGVFEFLPADMRPRHLLPLPRSARGGSFCLNPRIETEGRHGDPDALRYFGR